MDYVIIVAGGKDRWSTGVWAVVATELPVLLLWWLVLRIVVLPLSDNLRWLALAFIPPVLLLRNWAKKQQMPTATKGAIVTLFATFILFIVIYLRTA